jgi:hypothetical protein
MLKLGTIEQEATDCRKAFEGVEVGSLTLHCHHEVLMEQLDEPAEHRIAYILSRKPKNEQALRLRLFRPIFQEIINRNADWQKANADWQKAYADRQKADADYLQKAYADLQKAYADRQKANADWQKAYADWQKANADWQKAYADRQKANAELDTAIHFDVCKDCPWDGKTIFPEV